jgi:catechol 2,3-dioxygenase-like lactoylglutathione lyase family enzyme
MINKWRDSMSIFTHVTVGTKDLNKARAFYDNILSIIGLKRIADLDENGSIWGVDAPSFFVLKPANGQAASVGNGGMVSFEAPNRAAIDAFHAAALAAGCPDEGAPGTRDWAPHAYAAYTRDLDGNKLAVYSFKEA